MTSPTRANPFAPFSRAFNPDVMIMFIIKQNHARIAFVTPITLGTDITTKTQYEQHFWQIDPFFTAALASRRPLLVSSAAYPSEEWRDLPYYKSFLQPRNLDHELAVYVRENDEVIGGFSVLRLRGRTPFVEGDLAKAELLLPHLIQVVHEYLTGGVDSAGSLHERPRERAETGLVLLDTNLNVVGYNHSAIGYCLGLNASETDHHPDSGHDAIRLPTPVLDDCKNLKELFDNGLSFACSPSKRVLATNDGRMVVSTCSVMARRAPGDPECSFLVSLDDSLDYEGAIVGGLKEAAKLTTREWHIAQLVSGGQSNQDIASGLCISRYTVENHLKRVFAKVQVKNRTELAKWVLLDQGE